MCAEVILKIDDILLFFFNLVVFRGGNRGGFMEAQPDCTVRSKRRRRAE